MLPILTNFSPFPADVVAGVDPLARQHYLVVISASFEAHHDGPTRIADDQTPVADIDVYFGAPGESSVRYEADLAAEKSRLDVVINGTAYAPRGVASPQVSVRIRIDGVLEKSLVVSGDRFWRRGVMGLTPSSPEPFTALPIVYERAFGGSTGEMIDSRNPIGIGHAGAKSADTAVQSEVPNVEYPDAVVRSRSDKPAPAGFGFIARSWASRLEFAGTYDEMWKAEQFPLLPLDFDSRFYHAAPLDQQVAGLGGGEVVQILNMTPEGHWRFVVPRLTIPLRLRYSDHIEDGHFRVDTLLIEPDGHRFTLKARMKVALRRSAAPLQEVVVGQATRAWWRARTAGKLYLSAVRGTRSRDDYFAT
jgi:hypothetical protein